MRQVAPLLISALLVGCGGKTSSIVFEDASTSPGQGACASQAAAQCALRNSCTGGISTQISYENTAACVSAVITSCVANLSAPETAQTPAHVQACADAYPSESCVDWGDGNTTTACRSLAGPRANGAACGVSSQCASTFCLIGANAMCGTCAPVPQPGDLCESTSNCQYDLDCPIVAPATTGVCTTRGTSGSPCDGYHPCEGGLACVGSDTPMLILGTCQPGLTSVGATCDGKAGPGCDPELYLSCAAGTCQDEGLVGDGQPCADVGTGYVECEAGGLCLKPLGSTTGTCIAAVATGAACDSLLGPPCAPPGKCIAASDGGSSGTCVLPDPASCG